MLHFSSVVRGTCRDYRNFCSISPCLLPEMKTYGIVTSAIVLEGSSYERCDKSSYPSLVSFCVWRSFPPCLCAIPHFSYSRSNWFSPSFSTTFQNFRGIFDLLSQLPKFEHHTKLCSKCSSSFSFCLKCQSNLLMKRVFLLNAAFGMSVLALESLVVWLHIS
jgi:hypothetical protein